MRIIIEEQPNYLTLLTRKTSSHKMIETASFLIFVVILAFMDGLTNTQFKVGAVLSAIIVLSLSPLFYRWIVQPTFILTEVELEIKTKKKVRTVPLTRIEDSYDLKYIFQIDGKKEVLSVSDSFLDELNEQLFRLKMKK